MPTSHLLRVSSTTQGLNGHLVNLNGNKHLLRFSPFNKWYTISASAGKNVYTWMGTNYTSSQDFFNIQGYCFEHMLTASWADGFGMPMYYAGQAHAPSYYAPYQSSECLLWYNAYQFTVPTIFAGHSITAARILFGSAGALYSRQYTGAPPYNIASGTAAMRIRVEAGLAAPIAVMQANYTQIMFNAMNTATQAMGATGEAFNVWDWTNEPSPYTDHCIPRWSTAPTYWTNWDLIASAATTINANRTFWVHVGPTQDRWYFAQTGFVGCAMTSGVALQIYVE